MKKKLALGLGAILAVILAVVLIKQNEVPEVEESTSNDSKSDFLKDALPGFDSRRNKKTEREIDPAELIPWTLPADFEPVVIREGQSLDDLSAEQLALLEEQQEIMRVFISKQKERRFEAQLAGLVKAHDLDQGQQDYLRRHFEDLQASILAGDLQAHGALELLLSGQGVDEVLEEVLSEEQLASRSVAQERKREEAAEQVAKTEINHISSLLTLSKDQIEQVQTVLKESALDEGARDSSAADSEKSIEIANDLAAQLAGAEAGSNPLEAFIRNRQAQSRDEKLAQLSGILTEEQLESYRQSLELRDNDLSKFRKSLNAFEPRAK